jgi:hypothetical protein
VNDADDANEVGEANEADEIVEATEANDSDEAIESDESDDANEVDEANEADEADEADEVDETGVSIEMPLLEVDEASVSIEMPLLLPFSLTKYSAIFSEVKGSFEVNNNQILGFEAAVDDVRERPYDGNEIDNQLRTVQLPSR